MENPGGCGVGTVVAIPETELGKFCGGAVADAMLAARSSGGMPAAARAAACI